MLSRKFEMKIKLSREQCRNVVAGVDLLLLRNNCLKRYGDTCISFDESHATNSSHNKIMQQQKLCTEIVTPLRSWRYNMRTYVSMARYRICVCVCVRWRMSEERKDRKGENIIESGETMRDYSTKCCTRIGLSEIKLSKNEYFVPSRGETN